MAIEKQQITDISVPNLLSNGHNGVNSGQKVENSNLVDVKTSETEHFQAVYKQVRQEFQDQIDNPDAQASDLELDDELTPFPEDDPPDEQELAEVIEAITQSKTEDETGTVITMDAAIDMMAEMIAQHRLERQAQRNNI